MNSEIIWVCIVNYILFCFCINKDQVSFTSWFGLSFLIGKRDNDVCATLPVVYCKSLYLNYLGVLLSMF